MKKLERREEVLLLARPYAIMTRQRFVLPERASVCPEKS